MNDELVEKIVGVLMQAVSVRTAAERVTDLCREHFEMEVPPPQDKKTDLYGQGYVDGCNERIKTDRKAYEQGYSEGRKSMGHYTEGEEKLLCYKRRDSGWIEIGGTYDLTQALLPIGWDVVSVFFPKSLTEREKLIQELEQLTGGDYSGPIYKTLKRCLAELKK